MRSKIWLAKNLILKSLPIKWLVPICSMYITRWINKCESVYLLLKQRGLRSCLLLNIGFWCQRIPQKLLLTFDTSFDIVIFWCPLFSKIVPIFCRLVIMFIHKIRIFVQETVKGLKILKKYFPYIRVVQDWGRVGNQ